MRMRTIMSHCRKLQVGKYVTVKLSYLLDLLLCLYLVQARLQPQLCQVVWWFDTCKKIGFFL